ncbi:peptide deformylase [Patescibacteria group bacterium]
MSILEIQTGENNEILRKKSTPVEKVDRTIKKLAKNMVQTMKKANGLGIAAPQVGVNKRLFITTLNEGDEKEMLVTMINPEILWHSKEHEVGEEGCLSIPGIYKPVERFSAIRVKYLDLKGRENVIELEGLNARVIQHETDHLDGVLFVDRAVEGDLPESSSHVAF